MRIVVAEGLPEAYRTQAASVFQHAFEKDLTPALGAGPRAERFIAAALSPPNIIHLSDSDGCQGLLGLQWDGRGAFQTNAWRLMRTYAWWSVPRRLRHLNSFARATLPGEVLIEGFCIAPAYQGKGYGRAMIDAAIAHAKRQEATQLTLDVDADNTAALCLYAARGFVQTDPRGRQGTITLALPL